jgi:type II secretory pathway component PulF
VGLFVGLGFLDVAFLAMLGLVYVFVTRRRAKVYALVEHLASLASRSMPLATGLRMLAADLGGVFGARLGRVARRVEDGAPLGDALAAVPGAFPPMVRALVVQGERCGNLAAFLEELRRVYARVVEQSGRSVYVLFYPILVSVLVNFGLLGMHYGIVPKLQEIFLQVKAPFAYGAAWQWLLHANEAVLFVCFVVAALVFSGAGSARFGSAPFRRLAALLDPFVLWTPILGGVVKDGALGRFALGTGLFLKTGAGLADSVRAAADVEPNRVLARRFLKLGDAVAEGRRLSEAGRALRVLPDDLLWFVETGEAAGDLPGHLLQAAAHYDTKAQFAAQLASRAVAPCFLLLNGAIVLGTSLLLFLPLRDLIRKLTPW